MSEKNRILIVDDDKNVRFSIRTWLKTESYEIEEAATGQEAVSKVRSKIYHAVIMDIRMPGMNGLDAFKIMHEEQPHLPVIITTAYGTTETAIETMRSGAYEYLLKPMELKEIKKVLASAINDSRLTRKAVHLPSENENADPEDRRIIGNSEAMQKVYKLIGKASRDDSPVLITGPSGSGKELIARALYHHGRRNNKIFQTINCAAVPESLLESELFGHERGSFTGAHKTRIGRFEKCDGGTLFLDEIGDMPMVMQAKILRVLQEQTFERVGSNEQISTNVRIIAATNRNLEEMVESGQFREDLFYRLKVVNITVPSLKERIDDIDELLDYFIQRYNTDRQQKITGIAEEALAALKTYDWPGNVRELENAVRRAMVLTTVDVIRAQDFPLLSKTNEDEPEADGVSNELHRAMTALIKKRMEAGSENVFQEFEEVLIRAALEQTENNKVKAAQLLGINRNTLHNKMKRLS